MKTNKKKIKHHYHTDSLYELIVEKLTQLGLDLKTIKRSDLSAVDEFHVRGAAVSRELGNSVSLEGKTVLDVGCGIGGPCRMLADEFNCHATGLDLSKEYIRTAKELSKLVKLEDKTSFVQGDATNLPFSDESFDIVWTQHVQMNIADKQQFYNEIQRVLKKGGYFLYYDIFKNTNASIKYPMPWASDESLSFLFGTDQMNEILDSLGFVHYQTINQTQN